MMKKISQTGKENGSLDGLQSLLNDVSVSTTSAHLWVSIDIVSRPRNSTFDPDRWTDIRMSNETFCDSFW